MIFSGQGSFNRNLIFFTSLFVVVQKDSKFTKKSFFNIKLSKKGYPYLKTVLSLFVQSQGDNTFQVPSCLCVDKHGKLICFITIYLFLRMLGEICAFQHFFFFFSIELYTNKHSVGVSCKDK